MMEDVHKNIGAIRGDGVLIVRDELEHAVLIRSLFEEQLEPVSPNEKKNRYKDGLRKMLNKGKRWY